MGQLELFWLFVGLIIVTAVEVVGINPCTPDPPPPPDAPPKIIIISG
jgi:hypothetical protein